MAKNYFRNIPDFEYVNRTKDGQFISNYTQVKNFFKRGKLREDIFQDLTVFEKYSVKGDDRPDNVAFEIYGDANLDWVVLLSNNIINWITEFYDAEKHELNFDFEDEIISSSVLVHNGKFDSTRIP